MKFNIPTIGFKFILDEPWVIDLYDHGNNSNAFKWLQLKHPTYQSGQGWYRSGNLSVKAEIPAGTLLSVDRIYIRQGKADYDSITFNVIGLKGLGRVRFWVKLSELDNLIFTPFEQPSC